MKYIKGREAILAILFLLAVLSAACGTAGEGLDAYLVQEGAYGIDPLFREFYDHLGGEKVLGPPISTLFSHGSRKFQYVEAGALEYNSDLPASQAYRLSSLGLDMGISEPPVPPPGDSSVLYVNGHVISDEFSQQYQQLGGARFVGKPLTELHFNPEKQRYEQYFENLGFYWKESEPSRPVKLLAYGAWKCDQYCRYQPRLDAIVDPGPSEPAGSIEGPFREVVSRLGSDLTGFPLTGVYRAEDGKIEQVYENLVLFSSKEGLPRVSLRPLPEILGISPEPMVEASTMSGMYFRPLQGNLGYNVPQEFVNYITLHGGFEISGEPVGELKMDREGVFRQCFTNLCLEYHLDRNGPPENRIRPLALGYGYKELNHPPEGTGFEETQSLNTITLQVWEHFPIIAPDQSQEIAVGIFEGSTPLLNIEPVMHLTMPDGALISYQFPPTGPDGHTFIGLDPISAQHGTLIPYQVCISSITDEMFCVKESFVIWFGE